MPVEARPRISARDSAGPEMAAVAADRDRALAGGERLAAEGAAEVLGEALVDRLADDAADVVGLEDRSVTCMGRIDPRRWRRL